MLHLCQLALVYACLHLDAIPPTHIHTYKITRYILFLSNFSVVIVKYAPLNKHLDTNCNLTSTPTLPYDKGTAYS